MTTSLPPFKSAGAAPLRWNSQTGQVELLLAWEQSRGTKRCRYYEMPRGCYDGDQCEYLHLLGSDRNGNEMATMRLNFLGGKREAYEQASTETAAREFFEETNELITLEEAQTFVSGDQAQCIRLYGAYDLYLHWLSPALSAQVAEAYARIPINPPLACALALYWVSLDTLMDIRESSTVGFYINLHGERKPISHLIWSFCTKRASILKGLVGLNNKREVVVYIYLSIHSHKQHLPPLLTILPLPVRTIAAWDGRRKGPG